jgi:hypothetical protein
MQPTLAIRTDAALLPLGRRGLAIGRLADCDLVLDGDEVSRRHARLVVTPEGPVLVDRSRFGTVLNGEQIVGPTLVRLGDVMRIGHHELRVEPWTGPTSLETPPDLRERLRLWLGRYGTPEVAGLVAGPLAALSLLSSGLPLLLVVIAGSLAAAIGFYGVLGWTEGRQARDAADGLTRRPKAPHKAVLRDLVQEFGAAAAADTLLLRPLAYLAALSLNGGFPGLLVATLAVDLLFHGPVLGLLHWKLVARRSGFDAARAARPTTALRPPSIAGE